MSNLNLQYRIVETKYQSRIAMPSARPYLPRERRYDRGMSILVLES